MLRVCSLATSALAPTPTSTWSRTYARRVAPSSASSPISGARKWSLRAVISTGWRAPSSGWRSVRWCCRWSRAKPRPMQGVSGLGRRCCSSGCGMRSAAAPCLAEARRDAEQRSAIRDGLRAKLAQGDKALVGNRGFRRYLKTVSAEHFAVDETRVAEDARFDGLYVLRTNTKLTPLQVMLRYRDLLRVEQLFRQAKAVLATRPIYHSSDMAIRGHVFCSFLALLLVKELEDRLHRHNIAAEWDDILRDLDRLQEIELEQDGKRFLLRTPTTGVAGKLFQAVGVPLPPNLQELPLTTPQPAA